MSRNLLKKVKVASGKTAGVLARETLAMAKRAGNVPAAIKVRTAHVIKVTGKALRIKKLRSHVKKWEKKRWAAFTRMGEVIFGLFEVRAKNIWQRKDIKGLLGELRKCEAEIRKIKAQITQVEKNNGGQTGFHNAIFDLNAREKYVRLAAVKALGQSGNRDVIPILTKRLGDADLKVRQEAIRALHRIIDRESPDYKTGSAQAA